MAISKVVYDNQVLIDLSVNNTVKAEYLKQGEKAYGTDGTTITGTCDYDANTQSGNASASEILYGRKAWVKGSEVEGTMPNNQTTNLEISTLNQKQSIPSGYHNGGGKAYIADEAKATIIADNIKNGVTILGVVGTYSGGGTVNPQPNKTVTPDANGFEVTADAGYDYLAKVTIEAIPYVEEVDATTGATIVKIACS